MSPDFDALVEEAAALLAACRERGLKLATAESCTGGLIAAILTEVPGSSDVFERGFVTYSNEAKTEMLGVSAALIEKHGAVSAEVARAMAEGALRNSRADIAVSVTGVAGPGGGTAEKPVGLVHFGAARSGGERCSTARSASAISGGSEIRLASVAEAFAMARDTGAVDAHRRDVSMDKAERKAAVDAYKERKVAAGIYAIRCAPSGECWVGQTAGCLQNREPRASSACVRELTRMPRCRRRLQKHGADAFTFEVVEEIGDIESDYVRANALKERQAHWLAELHASAI